MAYKQSDRVKRDTMQFQRVKNHEKSLMFMRNHRSTSFYEAAETDEDVSLVDHKTLGERALAS